ncbi:hypothetical protein TWF506_003221 [Arthrobotrys conoides]|uniref:Uncharacterized protein n=1 Tax=Arthrobotrys conoides TaxID=74498 RepID=A0AAN8MYV5_9PEZI
MFFEFLKSQDRLEYIQLSTKNFRNTPGFEHHVIVPTLRFLKSIKIDLDFMLSSDDTLFPRAMIKSWILSSAKTLKHFRLEDQGSHLAVGGNRDLREFDWSEELLKEAADENNKIQYPRLPNLNGFEISSRLQLRRYLPKLELLFDYTILTSFRLDGHLERCPETCELLAKVVSKFENLQSLRLENTHHFKDGLVIQSAPPLRKLVYDNGQYGGDLPDYECFLRHKDTLRHLHLLNADPITIEYLNDVLEIWSWPCLETLIVLSENAAYTPEGYTKPLKLPASLKALHTLQTKLIDCDDPNSPHPDYFPYSCQYADKPSTEWINWWKNYFLSELPALQFPTIDTIPVGNGREGSNSTLQHANRPIRRRPSLRALLLGDVRRSGWAPFHFRAVYGEDDKICRWEGVAIEDIVARDPDLAILEKMDWGKAQWGRSIDVRGKWW